MAPKIRKKTACINKPDHTKTKYVKKKSKGVSSIQGSQNPPVKKKKLCFADLQHTKQKPICQVCHKSYANQTTLRRHMQKYHSLSPPKTINIENSTFEHSGRGRPIKLSSDHNAPTQLEKRISNFEGEFEKVFFELIKEQRMRDGVKKNIVVQEYAIYQDLKQNTEMSEIIQQALNNLLDSKMHENVKEFARKCTDIIRLFVEHLNANPHPELYDPFNSTQDYIEENNLEDFLQFQNSTNFFQINSKFETKNQHKWQYFADNFSKEFQNILKKDLLIITWASGVVRKDLFLEYFCLMLKVIETLSRFHKLQEEGEKVQKKPRITQIEVKNQDQMTQIIEENNQAFKKIGTKQRKRLIVIREEFINYLIRQSNTPSEKSQKLSQEKNPGSIKITL